MNSAKTFSTTSLISYCLSTFLALLLLTQLTQAQVYHGVEDPNLKAENSASALLAPMTDIILPTSGGPDAGGYFYMDNMEPGGPLFDWIEISENGTSLGLGDDSYYYPINLQFSFDFYGTNYSQVAVGSNGTVYFENNNLGYRNQCIPNQNDYGVDRFIALYWDDLYPSGSDNVYYKIVGTAPNRKLVVQWQNVRHYGSNSSNAVTAQAQLHENGDILLLYANPSSEAGRAATVGIQNDPSVGLQYSCNQPALSPGLAVLFTRNPGCSEPEVPESPQPEDGTGNVPVNTLLFWNGGTILTASSTSQSTLLSSSTTTIPEEEEWLAAHPNEVFPLASSTNVSDPQPNSVPGSELIGIDFDLNAGSPANWTRTTGGSTPYSLMDLQNETGTNTMVDLTLASTGGHLSNYSTTANASTIPVHTNDLTRINDYFYGGDLWTFTFSDLQPGSGYNVYVFGLRGFEMNNGITISGGSAPIYFEQRSTTPGNLWINGEMGSSTRTLQSFAEVMTPNGNGEIIISVEGLVNSATIAGLAIEATGSSSGMTYDVYFGTHPNSMALICQDTETSTCDPGLLEESTDYYWQVVAKNQCGQTAGPVWTFRTEGCVPPEAPFDPQPAEDATDVPVNSLLTWNGGSGGGPCDQPCGVENGGFETGEFTPWVAVTGPGDELTPWNINSGNSGYFDNSFPFEGVFSAQNGFDGAAGLYYDLYQETTIPECAPTAILTWRERIQWNMVPYGAALPREYVVSVQPAGGGTPLAVLHSFQLQPGTQGDTGYVTHSVDLLDLAPSIAGQTVRINFHEYVPERYAGPAQFDLDGISLVCGGQVLINTSQNVADTLSLSQSELQDLLGTYEQIKQRTQDVVPCTVFQNGMLIEDPNTIVSSTSIPSERQSVPIPGATLINFDDLDAPCGFRDTVRLTNRYSALGVIFKGPGGNDGGAILNQCSSFGVSGYSLPNFLAFNPGAPLSDGGRPRGTETLHFNPPVSHVEFIAGSGSHAGRSLNITAYDNMGNMVDTSSITLSNTLSPISVSGSHITEVEIADSALLFVMDDLQFIPETTGSVSAVYDVYLGTDPSQMEPVAADLEGQVFNPCILDYETTYFWQVIAKNDCGQTAGPIWSFTTQPWQPQPEDGVIDVPINTLLQWNGPVGGGNCDQPCGVENGGFETGDFAPWQAIRGGTTNELTPWNINSGNSGWFGNGLPFEGSFFAQNGFDGAAGLYYDLYQETTIPQCAPTAILTWSERIQWDMIGWGATLPREYVVSVQPAGGGTPLAVLHSFQLQPGTQGDTGYLTHSVDLLDLVPSIAGQTVRINFHEYIPQTSTGPAQFDLDGISLVCGGQVQTATTPNNVSPLQLSDSVSETLMAEYDLVRQSSAQVIQETDPSQGAPGGSIPLISQGYVLATTATQQAVDASDRGWWKNTGYHNSDNKNTYTGQINTTIDNSFFVFDLASITDNVVESAVLRLEVENYYGPDPSESLTIYDVSTPIPVLTASDSGNIAVFNDLQSGNQYGTFSVQPSDVGSIVEITLNSQAIADIEAAIGGQFAVGLHVNNITLPVGDEGVRFSRDDEVRVHQLILTTSTGGGGGGGGGGQGSPLTYDVYLGTDASQMQLVASDLEEPIYNPCILDYETTYFWQIIAKTDCGQTVSPIWSFTTEPWQPQPEDGEMDVPIETMLLWNGPAGGGPCDESCGVENGGFETGDFAPWQAIRGGTADELTPWDISSGNSGWFGNGLPFEGSFFAQNGFDGAAGLYYDLYQETTIPQCAPTAILTWSERIQWNMVPYGATLPREYVVSVQPAGGGTPLAVLHSFQLQPGTQGDTGYLTHSVDLLDLVPSIAGQTVRINFHEYIPQTSTGPAQFDLDGISLVCGGQVHAITTPNNVAPLQLSDSVMNSLSSDYEQIRQQALDAAAQARSECAWAPGDSDTPMSAQQSVQRAPSMGQFVNGDFEEGTLNGWQLMNTTQNGSFVINDGTFVPDSPDGPLPPYSGNYSALSEMDFQGAYTLYQDVVLPSGTSLLKLQWADMIRNHHQSFVDPDQEFRVEIWNLSNQTLATLFSTDPGDPLMTGWTERSADISAFAGQTVRIAFTVEVFYFFMNVHLDNIRIETGTTPPPPPTPNPIVYDVYFGLDPNDSNAWDMIGEDLDVTECDPTPEPNEVLRKGRVYYWQVVAKNQSCGEVVSPLWSFTTENTPPVADTGNDQVGFCWIDGFVDVTLDGSGSYDEDDNPITYLWTWTIGSDTFTETGVSPTITLPPGVHTITLVVNDSIDDSLPDEVVITAEAPVEITVNCTPKALNCQSNGNWITAHFTLPAECSIADIDQSAPCTLEPMGLLAHQVHTSNNDQGQGVLAMTFGRIEFCEMQPPLGTIQLHATGCLNSGHYFYGTDEIRILSNRMIHLSTLAQNWLRQDCGKPHWCDGQDINADGVVDLNDMQLIDFDR